MTTRRAVIDVGTNSIKLLVADVIASQVVPIWEGSKQTRLGRGLYDTQRLQPAAIAETAKAVAEFAAEARQHQAGSIRTVATSATRDALNARELMVAIEQAAGLTVEILSGDHEADLVFQGVTTDPELADVPLLLLDVGGGSTEFILGWAAHKHFRASFPLGSVRLMERVPQSDPPGSEAFAACREWVCRFLQTEVQPKLQPAIRREVEIASDAIQLVGTGGTATILARMEAKLEDYDRARIEKTRLSRDRVRWHVQHLWGMPLDQRKQIAGLPPSRADVILTGAIIFQVVMDLFDFSELRISTRGLRFGAVFG